MNSKSQTLATSADNVSFSFGDNPADQIVNQAISKSEYDSLETSTTQSYSVNGLNQYSAVAGVSYSWDSRGNLTSDGSTTYSYDLENHLTAAGGTYNASLSYDPLGRLYQTTSGSVTTDFIYDDDRIAIEYDGSGNLLRRYAYGPDGDDPLVWYEGSAVGQSNRRYLHSDQEGSIIAVTDGNGATLAVNKYDPYGIRGPSNQGRFQYTGQAFVPEVGLHYYKARMYNATLGRFMQTDPVGYKDDFDLYSYANNDPLNDTDPSGEDCDSSSGSGICDPRPPETMTATSTAAAASTATATSAATAEVLPPITVYAPRTPLKLVLPEFMTMTAAGVAIAGGIVAIFIPGNLGYAACEDTGTCNSPTTMAAEQETLTGEEQEAVRNKEAGKPYDKKAFNRTRQKQIKNEKYTGQRNRDKQRGGG